MDLRAQGKQTSKENDGDFSFVDQPFIEIENSKYFARRLLIDLLICQALINFEWTEHQNTIDYFNQAHQVSPVSFFNPFFNNILFTFF